jgi:Cd2+/Zn2+-exporting ATPase
MLIIACPCALVISTPTTILCGLHRASRLGILVKGGEFLERIGCVRWIALDKTGTVTQGRPHVVSIVPLGQDSDERVLQIAAALEQQSEHPLAAAILREARRRKLDLLPVDDVQAMRGFGVRGTVEGTSSVVGSLRYFEQQGWLKSDDLPIVVEQQSGISVVAVARQDQAIGLLLLRDEPRAEAQVALQQWRQLGVRHLVMLTGDHATAAREVASELGFDEYHADLLPDDKIERVRQMAQQQSALAMIGDGVNDAPALAAAPIGLALGSGASDVALETADVAILSPHLDRITALIQLSRKTRRILKQNIALAVGTKGLVMLLALLGHATMWMAVASDVGASLVVIFNGMRLLRPPP